MKLTCSKDLLLQYINIVNKAVSNRTTLPILECILLTANERGFIMTGNDLEIGIRTAPIEAEIQEAGEVAIEARIFNEIVEDFPTLPEVEQEKLYSMEQAKLRDMIRQTIFSIAQDGSKPVLTGELFELRSNSVHVVSVDGYRISFRKNSLLTGSGDTDVIVPGKTLAELNKILSQEEDDTLSIYLTEKHILFDLGTAVMVSRLIEGDFIRYAQSFSEDYKTKVVINKSELIQALERASLVSRDNRKTPVRLMIRANGMDITARSDMGTAHEALRSIEEETVKMIFMASLSPCTILPEEGDSFKYLILPLRM